MPIKIRKLPYSRLYRVYNADTKKIYSMATTLERAVKQQRYLNMLEKKANM
jgi:hypothetical protein